MQKYPREQINEELFLVLRTLYHFERELSTKFGLDFEEIYILQVLYRKEIVRVTDLANELQLPMFTVSRMTSRLSDRGMLTKDKASTDHRNIHLHITKKGEELIKKIEIAAYDRIFANIENLDENEMKELLKMPAQLHKVLGVSASVIK